MSTKRSSGFRAASHTPPRRSGLFAIGGLSGEARADRSCGADWASGSANLLSSNTEVTARNSQAISQASGNFPPMTGYLEVPATSRGFLFRFSNCPHAVSVGALQQLLIVLPARQPPLRHDDRGAALVPGKDGRIYPRQRPEPVFDDSVRDWSSKSGLVQTAMQSSGLPSSAAFCVLLAPGARIVRINS